LQLCQFGAVDGEGNELLVNIRPPISWESCLQFDTDGFFARNNFQRFFGSPATSELSLLSFDEAWVVISNWLNYPHSRQRMSGIHNQQFQAIESSDDITRDSSRTVYLVAHNGNRYDLPVIEKELFSRKVINNFKFVQSPLSDQFRSQFPHNDSNKNKSIDGEGGALGDLKIVNVDSLQIIQQHYKSLFSVKKGSWTLAKMYEDCVGGNIPNHHDALNDAHALRNVFLSAKGTFFRSRLEKLVNQHSNSRK
jgi:hypothetical protein